MEYKYKAFISYRHLAPDMQAAEKLQKLLEGYKPPKNLGREKENWRIFRDVSELQSSSDLSEDIKNAIEIKNDSIKAYVVNKGMKEIELHLGNLTDDEREIILKGCLINYNRV